MWQTLVLTALAFWLSGSFLMDVVMMPVFYASGMMIEPGFASTAYSLFWVFNRIELLCAAVTLTGALVLYITQPTLNRFNQRSLLLASLLLCVALVCTYGLAPQMSALGLQLNLFAPTLESPRLMNSLHLGYWSLEVLKLLAGGILIKLFYRAPAEAI